MASCEVVAKRWGNSIGVVLPKEIVEKENIKENKKIMVLVLRKDKVLSKTFGMLKGKFKKSTQEIKDKLREELYDD